MTCEVKSNALLHLQNVNAIDNNQSIIDPKKFLEEVNKLTQFASIKYGLDTKNDYLFTKETDEKGVEVAVPNEILFDDFQILKNKYDGVETDETSAETIQEELPETSPTEAPFAIDNSVPLVDINIDKINDIHSRDLAELMAMKMANKMKVDYFNISAKEATDLLKNTAKPYNSQPAFYYAGNVYFVGENITADTVLHEFSHPLMQAIRIKNPVLFNSLYDTLASTVEGKSLIDLINKTYPELDTESPLFKEEALVYSLQLATLNKINKQIESDGFKSFLNKLIAGLKQVLRGLFGTEVFVKNLSPSTSINELAEMLLDETSFNFENAKLTEQDLVMYAKDVTTRALKLIQMSKSAENLQDLINTNFATNSAIYKEVLNFKGKKLTAQMLYNTLRASGTTALLPDVVKNMKRYETLSSDRIEVEVKSDLAELEELQNKAKAFVNSFDKIDRASENIINDLNKILKQANIIDNSTLGLVNIYKNTAYSWSNLISEVNDILDEDNPDRSNEFYQVINKIANELAVIQTKISEIYKKNNIQFFVENTSNMNKFIKEQFKKDFGNALKNIFPDTAELELELNNIYNKVVEQRDVIPDLQRYAEKGAPLPVLQKFITDYAKYIIDESKIKDALTGHAKDVSWFNRWLESYTSSNDPIVGSLALFIENQKTKVLNEVWKNGTEFRNKLAGLLGKINFNKMDSLQLRDMLATEDEVFYFDKKTGQTVPKKVWTFLNDFGNGWRFQLDQLEYNYAKAKDTGDKDVIGKALQDLRQFKKDYMWQEYTSEYYEKDDIFKESEIGALAYAARKNALDEYNNLQNEFDREEDRYQNFGQLEAAYRKYQQLYSPFTEGSVLKIDDPAKGIYDKSIYELLTKHREATKDFYEFIPIKGSLENSYNEFTSSLLLKKNSAGKPMKKTDQEFIDQVHEWTKQNVKMVYADEFYKARNRIFTRLAEIQAKQREANKNAFDVSEAYKTISNLIYSFRDDFGQPDASKLGPERLQKIKELQQSIVDFQSKMDFESGLSKEDSLRLEELEKIKKEGEFTNSEAKEYIDLNRKLQVEGIDPGLVAEMKDLLSELKDMSSKMPTEYYLDNLNLYLSKYSIREVKEADVDDFINSDAFFDLVKKDEALGDWFHLNHIIVEAYENNQVVEKFQRTAANSVTRPSDPTHYKTTTIVDSDGETITIMGVPNSRHSRLEIKDKYRTIPKGKTPKEYIGIYVDNKGNFLPRSFEPGKKSSAVDDRFIDKRYKALKAKPDSPEFQLLEEFKKYHLKMQDGKSNYGKLYLDLPRYGARGDVYQTFQKGLYGDKINALGKNVKEWMKLSFGKSNEDHMNNLNYDPENNLVHTNLNGDRISYIPVTGIFNLDSDVVNADIFSTLDQYHLSLFTHAELTKSLPLVESILSTLEDPKNQLKDLNAYSENIVNGKNKRINPNKKATTNNRAGQVRSLLEREWYGRNVVGIEENHPTLSKWLNTLTKLSSSAALAVNIPSDLKNQVSGYVQTLIESSGGEFITSKDFALSAPWSTKALLEWTSKSIYQKEAPALSSQLIQLFDVSFKTKDNLGKSVYRSLWKDLANGEWMMMHRKFGEMDVAMKLFGSFMFGQKVEMEMANGKKDTIRYIDAWETDENGIAKLKEGVHPSWNYQEVFHEYQKGETLDEIAKKYNITVDELKERNRIKDVIQLEDGQEIVIAKSEFFMNFKNKMQAVSRRLYGAYDDFGQAEGNK